MNAQESEAVSATRLIYRSHDVGEFEDTHEGVCSFCGHSGVCVGVEDAVSQKYFSDYDLMDSDTGEVCVACAFCMSQRSLKQGHWLVDQEHYESVSTGDLVDLFDRLRAGEMTPPVAVHISENPIRSEHAYLWTPVVADPTVLDVTYGRQRVRFEWETFETLLDAVEELRWHGFRGDDIRSGEPRVRDLEDIGTGRYRDVDRIIEPHRGTALLDLVWTVSRSRDDQPTAPNSAT